MVGKAVGTALVWTESMVWRMKSCLHSHMVSYGGQEQLVVRLWVLPHCLISGSENPSSPFPTHFIHSYRWSP